MIKDICRTYRDPIYGYIYVPKELEDLLNSTEIFRLRGVRQNGCTSIAYPSLIGSRFEHSIGTMYLAMEMWDICWNNTNIDIQRRLGKDIYSYLETDSEMSITAEEWIEETPEVIRISLGAVGLLHDVGHPAYSHTLENVFWENKDRLFSTATVDSIKKLEKEYPNAAKHELYGYVITEKILEKVKIQCNRVSAQYIDKLILALFRAELTNISSNVVPSWAIAVSSIISGYAGADRLDYLKRDSHHAGAEYGAIDEKRLMNSMRIRYNFQENGWELGYTTKAVSAVESLLTCRDRAYRWIYNHYAVLAADRALKKYLNYVFSNDDYRLDYIDISENDIVATDAEVRFLAKNFYQNIERNPQKIYLKLLYEVGFLFSRKNISAWQNYRDYFDALSSVDNPSEIKNLCKIISNDPSPSLPMGYARVVWSIYKECGEEYVKWIEDYLNKNHSEIFSVGGTWIICLSNEPKGAPNMPFWEEDVADDKFEAIEFSKISSSAQDLDSSSNVSIPIWGFFIPYDYKTIKRSQIDELHKRLVQYLVEASLRFSKEEK